MGRKKLVAEWAASTLIVPPGHYRAGEPMVLLGFAVDWLRASWDAHEAAISTARKSGKSAIAAVLALGYLVGPLRRPGWRGAIASCRRKFASSSSRRERTGWLARKLDQLARFDVVIFDELGYVPFDKTGADLLFGFISQRYERRSLVVTTNLPFARWSEVFLNATAAAAVIDRIVHHATVLTTAGDSFRLKAATRNHASRMPQEVPRQ